MIECVYRNASGCMEQYKFEDGTCVLVDLGKTKVMVIPACRKIVARNGIISAGRYLCVDVFAREFPQYCGQVFPLWESGEA